MDTLHHYDDDAGLFVVNSVEGGTAENAKTIAKSKEELDQVRMMLKNEGIKNEVMQTVRGLSPGEDLVRFAEENHIDHIFVGVEKKSKTQKIILGSTAQYVILKAGCPVTTVK